VTRGLSLYYVVLYLFAPAYFAKPFYATLL